MADDKATPPIEPNPPHGETITPNESATNEETATSMPAISSLAISSSSQPSQPPVVEDVSENEDNNLEAEDIRQEFLSLLPPNVLPRIDHLKALHGKRDELLTAYQVERAALEVKYAHLMKPIYEERKQIVNGALEAAKKNDDANADAAAAADEGEESAVKGIPQFWACAMGNMDVIAELIAEEDVDCLEFLTDIQCNNFPDGSGFELAFHFSDNPYFTNTVLTKTYEVPNLLTEDEPILKNVKGTEINWKSGQCLTHKTITKKQRKKGGRGAGQIRTVTKKERQESFFHFFSPPKMPALAQVMDEEEADAVEEAFDHDYDVAQAFRGCVVPNAVLWFTGQAMDDDYDDLDGFIVGDEDEEDTDAEADGNGGAIGNGDTGASEFQFKFDGGTGGGSAQPGGANGENPECKQS